MEEIKKEADRIYGVFFQAGSVLHADRKKTKQCALMCIDEKIKELQRENFYKYTQSRIEFQEQVKQYIIDNY